MKGTPASPRTFTADGARNGSPVWVRWTEGELAGDPPTIDLMLVEAEAGIENMHDPMLEPSWAERCGRVAGDPLADPAFVRALIDRVFNNVREITSVPEDLVAGIAPKKRRKSHAS